MSEVLGINTKTGDALGIAKQLGEVVGIKVGLSLIFSDAARGEGLMKSLSRKKKSDSKLEMSLAQQLKSWRVYGWVF